MTGMRLVLHATFGWFGNFKKGILHEDILLKLMHKSGNYSRAQKQAAGFWPYSKHTGK